MAQKPGRKGDSGRFNLRKSEENSKELVKYRYMAWALAISNCRKYTWALAREQALSIHPTKITTWVLTLARMGVCPGDYSKSFSACLFQYIQH